MSNLHPVFTDRPPPQARLWRYLTAEKLLALLELKYLHFTRIDQLDNHFEGAWPATSMAQRTGNGISGTEQDSIKTRMAALCWVESPNESAAMWRLHAPSHNSVAITTTFGQMEALMKHSKLNEYCDVMNVARVRYEDPLAAKDPATPLATPHELTPFMTKHASYSHECEVRALAVSKPNYEIETSGLDIEIDLFNFVHNFVISPFCDAWFTSMLYGVLSKYHVEGRLRHSSLARVNTPADPQEIAKKA